MKKILEYKWEIFIFLIVFAIYFLFSNQKTPIYNHHVFIADAFLHGRFELQNPPSWHNDVAIVDGRKYGIYGPAPAVLLLPFVAIAGLSAPEGFLNLVIATSGIVIFWRILSKLNFTQEFKIWLTGFFAFGTLHFFSAAHDQTWWFTYIVASFFLLLTINELLGKKRGFLIGLAIGAAFATRAETVFALIFALLLINFPKISLRNSLFLFLGFLLPFTLVSYYNFARFGNIADSGYSNFVLREPGAQIPYGLFDIRYFPANFYTYFLAGPEIIPNFPYLRPPWMGMSILLISPAFFYILKAIKKEPLAAGVIITTVLMSVPSLTYYLPGWTEFGWKHSVVFTPFLVLLIALGMEGKLSFFKIFLIIWSVIANLWGVLWWRLAGWFY